MDALTLRPARADEPGVAALLAAHLAHSDRHSPETSRHVLDADALGAAGVRLWVGEVAGAAVVCGALKAWPSGAAEVKSVHAAAAHRRRGLGAAMVRHLIGVAQAEGRAALVLETGSERLPGYDPARRLYEGLGFERCGPIEGYAPDPASAFYRLVL